MPPSRFSQVSRYRNAGLHQSKPDERYSELGIASTPDSGSGKVLAVTPASSHIFARSANSSNGIIVLPLQGTRKYGKQPPMLSGVCNGHLGDFDLCRFQDNQNRILLAAGSQQGDITLQNVALPSHDLSNQQFGKIVLPEQKDTRRSLKSPTSKAISLLSFHPTCKSLFLTASNQEGNINIWDAECTSTTSSPILQWEGGNAAQWDAQWSADGSQLVTCGRDSLVRIWDLRNAKEKCIQFSAHASKIKPIKATFIRSAQPHLMLTTGFSQMRQREIAIWDQRNHSSPLKRIIMDVASSPLESVCDYDRGIVYMTAKGESTIRWIDVGSEDQGGNFAEGAHALNFAATSSALGPPSGVDLSVGEIGKLFVASAASGSSVGGASTSDCIVPASIRVPRRTYIDFHSDLYPLTPDRRSNGIVTEQWLKGENPNVAMISLDPASRNTTGEQRKQNGHEEVPKSQSETASTPAKVTDPTQEKPITPAAPKASNGEAPPAARTQRADPSSNIQQQTSAAKSSAAPAKDIPSRTATASQTPPVHWSRRFLAGSTPLVPSFQNLSSLDLSRAPAAKMIQVTPRFFLFPVSGPGGRLGVHPLEREGRLPLHMPSFQHGAVLGDFVGDPFHEDRVITSAADGLVRLWRIPAPPSGDEEWPSILGETPFKSVNVPSKISDLCVHPHVEGLVAALPADADGSIHLIDLLSESIVKSISAPAQGIYNAVWSPDGSVLAAAGKDRALYILDPRARGAEARPLGKAPAHDSPRPFNIVWIDEHHLLTVGHTTGSLRELKLFEMDYSSSNILTQKAKQSLDVSPSILSPHWDSDVSILWLWSKGERLVSSFEVQPENEKEPFLALPAFQHSQSQLGLAFLRKDCVNVRDVEIDCSIRLCKDELQRVAWKITRSRPEFFQDDIFQPTVVIEEPLLDVADWMLGKDAMVVARKSLQPKGMVPLSEAPAVNRVSKLPKGPTQREKTDKEREEEMLSSIFEKAKGNDEGKDPNHNEDQAARAPDEDDWGSD